MKKGRAICSACTGPTYQELLAVAMYTYKAAGNDLVPWYVFHGAAYVPNIDMLRRVYPMAELKQIDPARHEWRDIPAYFYKLDAFSLYEFERVLLFDCDLIFTGSVEHLWNFEEALGAHKELIRDAWNSGVVTIGEKFRNPNTYGILCETKKASCTGNYGNDQRILNHHFWRCFEEIGQRYNCFSEDTNNCPEPVIIHLYKKGRTRPTNEHEAQAFEMLETLKGIVRAEMGR